MISIFWLAKSSCKIHRKPINFHRFFTASFHSLSVSPITCIPNTTVLRSASKVMASESTDNIRVLVTGASGYIAAHVVQQLLDQGYQVRGTVRSLTNELKVAPLKKLGEEADNRLELVEADLMNQECWKDAVKGCTYVIHTASPFPIAMPRDENQIIKPAVEGTLNVLNACVGNVKRVVLTSSVAAIGEYHCPEKKLSEADWTDIDRPGVVAYVKSKKLSEKSAWEFLESLDDDAKFEMAVINPAFVLGPVLTQQRGTSSDFLRRIMSGRDPVVPRICFSITDVRDVAKAHVIAMTIPEAAGNRHIISGDRAWFHEISAILKEEFGPQGYNPPTRQMPRVLLTVLSWFDGELRSIKDMWDVVTPYDTTRMREVLKIEPTPLRDSIIEMAYSLIESGKIAKKRDYKGRPQENETS